MDVIVLACEFGLPRRDVRKSVPLIEPKAPYEHISGQGFEKFPAEIPLPIASVYRKLSSIHVRVLGVPRFHH